MNRDMAPAPRRKGGEGPGSEVRAGGAGAISGRWVGWWTCLLAVRSCGGARGEHVVAAELEHEVEKVVVAERRAGLGPERLGGDLPHLGANAAGHQQGNDVVVSGLAHLVTTGRTAERVVGE